MSQDLTHIQQFNQSILNLGITHFIQPIQRGLATRGINVTTEELLQYVKLPSNTGESTTTTNATISFDISSDYKGRGRRPKEDVPQDERCIYIMQRGAKAAIGQVCQNRRVPGFDYCKTCLNKAGVKKLLDRQSTPTRPSNGLADPTPLTECTVEIYNEAQHLYLLSGHDIIIYWEQNPDDEGAVSNPIVLQNRHQK